MQLYYLPGSPYARITRIVALELGAGCEFILETEFPPRQVAALNPAAQVPTLVDGGRSLFGTRLITEYLVDGYGANAAGEPPFDPVGLRPKARWRDGQIQAALEGLMASIVTRSYLIWTKAEHQPGADIDLDLTAHETDRIQRLLDWLETEASPEGFLPGVFSLQDMWLIAAIGFTEARIPINWRGRPNLESICEGLSGRESIEQTLPLPWTPWD